MQFLFYCKSNSGFEAAISTTSGAQAEVVAGGMPQLARYLASSVSQPIRFDEAVVTINQQADQVTVTSNKAEYHADRVVVAIPPSMLSSIEFTPALPVAKTRLAQQMPMGSVIKAIISYRQPFWRKAGLSGEASSHTQPFNTVFDASWPAERGAALVGFFDGQRALDYADASEAERQQAVLGSLAFYFGEQARTNIGYVDYNWLQDPWAKGCYVGVMTPGTLSSLGSALRQPAGKIHWAGTETAAQWCGYIEGALASGERVATEISAALS